MGYFECYCVGFFLFLDIHIQAIEWLRPIGRSHLELLLPNQLFLSCTRAYSWLKMKQHQNYRCICEKCKCTFSSWPKGKTFCAQEFYKERVGFCDYISLRNAHGLAHYIYYTFAELFCNVVAIFSEICEQFDFINHFSEICHLITCWHIPSCTNAGYSSPDDDKIPTSNNLMHIVSSRNLK